MNKLNFLGLMLATLLSSAVFAFSTVDEQIDSYLNTLETADDVIKGKMLERLQWSGLREERLYDVIESEVLENYQPSGMGKVEFKTYLLHIRALGYSGNEKYRKTLDQVRTKTTVNKTRNIAKRALMNLNQFVVWNEKIANSDAGITGKSAEITAYMKMLNVDDPAVQRMAAKAIYHTQLVDEDLLKLVADKLIAIYRKDGLSKIEQDVAAWFCKALGQSGKPEFRTLLTTVTENTPYKKIKKYARKYAG
jgi:DNA-binding phage protein